MTPVYRGGAKPNDLVPVPACATCGHDEGEHLSAEVGCQPFEKWCPCMTFKAPDE